MFWISDEVTKDLANNQKALEEWEEGANMFLDTESIKFLGKLNKPFSMTWVNEDTQPQYPEHCDVIDSWCFSLETPRCPKEILDSLNSFQNETAYNWSSLTEKQKSGTIHRFLDKLKKEIEYPKRKTDNILMILLNGMKMIRVPQDYIDKVKEYVRVNHV